MQDVIISFHNNEITDSNNGLTNTSDLKTIDLLIKRIEFMEKQAQEDRASIRDLITTLSENQTMIKKLVNG